MSANRQNSRIMWEIGLEEHEYTMVTSDLRLEVEIRQFRTCTENDSVGHNGLSYGADTTFHRTYF